MDRNTLTWRKLTPEEIVLEPQKELEDGNLEIVGFTMGEDGCAVDQNYSFTYDLQLDSQSTVSIHHMWGQGTGDYYDFENPEAPKQPNSTKCDTLKGKYQSWLTIEANVGGTRAQLFGNREFNIWNNLDGEVKISFADYNGDGQKDIGLLLSNGAFEAYSIERDVVLPLEVAATATLPDQGKNTYVPQNALSENRQAWCAPGNASGEGISYSYPTPINGVETIVLDNGYTKDASVARKNHRPKEIVIILEGPDGKVVKTQSELLPYVPTEGDTLPNYATRKLPILVGYKGPVSKVTVEVKSVYDGTAKPKYADTCLSELQVIEYDN